MKGMENSPSRCAYCFPFGGFTRIDKVRAGDERAPFP
jgi:hypothetical protein